MRKGVLQERIDSVILFSHLESVYRQNQGRPIEKDLPNCPFIPLRPRTPLTLPMPVRPFPNPLPFHRHPNHTLNHHPAHLTNTFIRPLQSSPRPTHISTLLFLTKSPPTQHKTPPHPANQTHSNLHTFTPHPTSLKHSPS